MYLWCNKCHHAHHRDLWKIDMWKYGVCPNCGCSGFRQAKEWERIAAANGYPDTPDRREVYSPSPLLW